MAKRIVGEHTLVSYIYCLTHPATGDIRYIGKANSPKERLKTHLKSLKLNYPLQSWIKKLALQNLLPQMEIIKIVHRDTWEEHEKEIIALYRKYHNLLNVTDGGNEPRPVLDERRKRDRYMKANATKLYNEGKASERMIATMRRLAKLKPKEFKQWAKI